MIVPGPPTDPDPLARLARAGPRPADGIWDRIGTLLGRNRINATFYDGPSWTKFRPWERLFLTFQGGARRARRQILRHLDGLGPDARVLEVGIGDGENLRFLPSGWTIFGVDLARSQLVACLGSHPRMRDLLAWAEAEHLPFADAVFDACYSIGGFTYFGDHARALAEMARVTRPGGVLVVADEVPHIYRYGIGRVVGRPRLIRWWLDRFGVDPEFTSMILEYHADPEAAIRAAWPGATRHAIWSGLGYCYSAIRPDRPPTPPAETRPMTATKTAPPPTADWTAHPGVLRCVACGQGLMHPAPDGTALACDRCGHAYPVLDGVLVVNDAVAANNKVASDYYNGTEWPKFRFWEWFTFALNGGERRSRNRVLKHLPQGLGLKLLDVAVGDGVYLDWLPRDWSVVGIDVSTAQLAGCRARLGRDPGRDVRLILGEAEDLPVRDGQFDAALSIGAFNYFNDPERALREMARAVRPGGTIVVSDEIPNLTDRMLFRHIGLPQVDRWIAARIMKHLSADFTAMVEKYHDLDVRAIAERVLPGVRYELIWMGVGYVFVGTVPE